MKALILAADGFEDLTLFLPWYRLREEGVEVTLACPFMHAVTGSTATRSSRTRRFTRSTRPNTTCCSSPTARRRAAAAARGSGGRGPHVLRGREKVAAIGHGAQLLISAGTLDGRRVTCSPGIRDDVRAAGAVYSDEATVTDGNLLTGRGPDDLPAFAQAMMVLLGVTTKKPTRV